MKKVLVMSVVLATLVWTMGLATFVPAVSAATLTAGDLIKGSGSAVYFYAADGKRYTFPTLSTYMTWYSDFSKVKTITDSELAAISLAGNVVVRAGTKLVKIDTVPKVFAVEPKGKLVWVASEAVATTLYGADWAKRIVTIPDGFWTNYTDSGLSLSGTTYPEGQLVKWAGSTNVYYVTGGKKALVSTDAAFAANMWKTADVVTAPAAITLAEGTAIAGVSATLVDVSQGGGAGSVVPVAGAGTLTVALAGDTPAASPVASAATANFVKFGLTANGAAMTVSKVTLTKGGYSGTGDVENIKITDLSGVALTNSTGLNTNGTAGLTFSPALSLAAGETRYFYVRSGISSGVSSGVTASFSIAASSDVTSSAAAVAGNFPVIGNAMSVISVTIGSAVVYADGSVTNTTPDAGDENVIVNKFRVEAGTTESVTVESLTLLESGTAGLSDVKNIELWDVTQNKTLGTVLAYDSNGKASFSGLNIVIGKGEIHRFQVRLDIVSGAGLNVNADLTDNSDVLMSVKGNAYGFYITPTVGGGWDGKGAANQVINTGALSITKSVSSPATGKIAEAADQLLAIWDVEAKGEEVKVSAFKVTFGYTGSGDGADLISCKLSDEKGLVVAGPTDGTDATDYVNFTDTFIVPVGTHKYSLKCRLFDSDANDFGGAASYQMTVTGSTGITAKGYSTNDSITASGTGVANVMSVAVAALSATTLGTPAAQSVAAGTADMIWATFSLNANNSGENINVTAAELLDTLGDAGDDANKIDNVEVWCDLTSSSSDRGDVYEKKVSDTENFVDTASATETLAMNFSETVVVPKNSFVKCAVVADLGSGAVAGDTHRISLNTGSNDVTATGADTGSTVTLSASGNGQVMTVASAGVLTITVDSTSPKAAVFVSSEMKQTLGVFKLAATSVESLELDQLILTDDGTGTGVATYYLYSSKRADGVAVTEPIASVPGQAAATVVVADGVVSIPAGSYVLITVKGDINYIDGTTIDNAATIETTIAAGSSVLTTGLSSGTSVAGSGSSYAAATHELYEARPVVTKDSSSPSGTLSTGTSALVAVFKVDNTSGTKDIVMSAAGDDDMVFSLSGFSSGSSPDAVCTGCSVVFKDKNGNTLGTATNVDLSGDVAITANLDFVTGTLTVPAGDYELIKVYANTTNFTTAGNSLQVWLDDDTDANFSWGIDSSAGGTSQVMETAAITFRGDIYANTLGK